MDDKTQRHSPDNKRINLEEAHEVRYWTQALSVNEHDLRNPVAAVGDSADKVRQRLKSTSP